MGANRDRASARCRDLQCPGRRSLCRRAKRAGLSTDHGRPSARAAGTRSFASARSPLPRKFAAPLSRNATPSLPKPPTPFSKPPSPFTNQTECPLIPLYKGITGLPQQTEECCPRLPCVRGAACRGRLRGCLPFLPLFFPYFPSPSFPQNAKKSLSFYTTDFS